jgi:hypothetical protein
MTLPTHRSAYRQAGSCQQQTAPGRGRRDGKRTLAVVENVILDKNVVVLEGATVGVDKDHDRARGLAVSSGGVTVVGKGRVVAP